MAHEMKYLLVLLIFSLSSCTTTPDQIILPDGSIAKKIDCVSNVGSCFAEASDYCEGAAYRAIDSWSNAGGAFADLIPGPFTWYHMIVSCGVSDSSIPEFPFRGSRYQPSTITSGSSTTVSCTRIGDSSGQLFSFSGIACPVGYAPAF